MSQLNLLKIYMLSMVLLSSFSLVAQEVGTTILAEQLFEKSPIRQFMRKNCALCHDETATYPVGPTHSHSDSKAAFLVVKSKIDWGYPERSSLLTSALNQHYCQKFGQFNDNCANPKETASQFQALFNEYMSNLKTSQLKADQQLNGQTEFRVPLGALHPGLIRQYEKLKSFQTDSQLVKVVDEDTLSFPLKLGENETQYKLNMQIKRYAKNYFQITKLFISSLNMENVEYVVFQGLFLLKNGISFTQQLGFERLDRALLFSPGEFQNQTLASETPLLELEPGDSLSFRFIHLDRVSDYPATLCRDNELYKAFFGEMMSQGVNLGSMSKYGLNSMSQCIEFESKIDLSSPRRSVLLEEVVPPYKRILSPGISTWLSRYISKHLTNAP